MASAEDERTSGSLSWQISCREVTSALCANQLRVGMRGLYDCRGGRWEGGCTGVGGRVTGVGRRVTVVRGRVHWGGRE